MSENDIHPGSVANRPGGPRPNSSATATRRRPGGAGGGAFARSSANSSGMAMLRFFTDEAPGIKVTPVAVLIMSVCFISFVTLLHAISKVYQYRTS